jgi:hypothetical protein
MTKNTKRSGVPRYHRFSPYNFAHSDFLAAARRFLELREALVAAEERSDAEHSHEYFVSCDLCDRWSELKTQYEHFANQFAYRWALKLVESAPVPEIKKPPATATIECTVCRREVPEKEFYAEHITCIPASERGGKDDEAPARTMTLE